MIPHRAPTRPSLPRQTSATLAIVDNDAWATRAIEATLANRGFSVVGVADNGSDAIALAQQHRPRLFLVDLNMPPGLNGIETTRGIRQVSPHTSVLILTAEAPGPAFARAIEAGAAGVMSKAAPPALLVRSLRKLLSGESLQARAKRPDIGGSTRDEKNTRSANCPDLTETEVIVLGLLARGLSYHDIADELSIAKSTVRTHAQHLREKLHAHSISQMVYRGLQLKFISVC